MLVCTTNNGEWVKGGINDGELIIFRLRKMTGIAYGSRNHEHRSYLDSIEIKLLQVLTFSVGIHVLCSTAEAEFLIRE